MAFLHARYYRAAALLALIALSLSSPAAAVDTIAGQQCSWNVGSSDPSQGPPMVCSLSSGVHLTSLWHACIMGLTHEVRCAKAMCMGDHARVIRLYAAATMHGAHAYQVYGSSVACLHACHVLACTEQHAPCSHAWRVLACMPPCARMQAMCSHARHAVACMPCGRMHNCFGRWQHKKYASALLAPLLNPFIMLCHNTTTIAAYIIANLATTLPNDIAKLVVHAAASDLYCNTLSTSESLCSAETYCTYNASAVRSFRRLLLGLLV